MINSFVFGLKYTKPALKLVRMSDISEPERQTDYKCDFIFRIQKDKS